MFGFQRGKILNQADYERCGMADRWYYRDTVILLSSFEMEVKGYGGKSMYDSVYAKYDEYLAKCLLKRKFEYNDGVDAEEKALDALACPGEIGFDIDNASFDKNMFMSYIEANNICKINIDRLKRFLSGEEAPITHSKIKPPAISDNKHATVRKTNAQKDIKMQELAVKSHKSRNDAKDDIRKYIKMAMLEPCTCNHAQMARHIAKLSKDQANPDGVTLSYKNGVISSAVLMALVKEVFETENEENRIKNKNMIDKKCPKHRVN